MVKKMLRPNKKINNLANFTSQTMYCYTKCLNL